MYFDGTTNKKDYGIGAIIVSLNNNHTSFPIKLNIDVTNNIIEYKACIKELEVALGIGIKEIKVHGDYYDYFTNIL